MHEPHYYLHSKLNFVEAKTACFSQCYVSLIYCNYVYKHSILQRRRRRKRRRRQLEHKQSTVESSLPSTTSPLLLLLLRILHSPLSEEEDQKQSTVHDSSLVSPPASAVSTANHYASASPFLSASYAAFAIVRRRRPKIEHNSWQLPQLTTGLRRFHRQPLLFLFPFPFSFTFVSCKLSTVHGRTGSDPNLNVWCLSLTQ